MKTAHAAADLRGFHWPGRAWCRALQVRRDIAYGAVVAAQARLHAQEEAARSFERQHVREAGAALQADALCGRAVVLDYLAGLHAQAVVAHAAVQRSASDVSQAREQCVAADRRLACAEKLQAAASAHHVAGQQARATREADLLWLACRGRR